MPTVATWNVNSINARLPNLLTWLGEASPDIVLLQETKCVDEAFPRLEIMAAGYQAEVHGQKSYNGVAILAKEPIEDVRRGLPGDDEDAQARYLEATVGGLRVASIYLPNGNPVGTEKFPYKLAWMERLRAHARGCSRPRRPSSWGATTMSSRSLWTVGIRPPGPGDALFQPETRRAFRSLLNLGLHEAFRVKHPGETGAYTFWDYQGGAWQADNGIRIDHFLLSPQAVDRLVDCRIDKVPRGQPKASDHTPVLVELEG